MELIAGPFLSYASIRLRYCLTRARHVSRPDFMASCTCEMVASSTSNGAAACAKSETAVRVNAPSARIIRSLYAARGVLFLLECDCLLRYAVHVHQAGGFRQRI